MRVKSKVILAITMLFLVSTIISATSVKAVKTGGGKEDNITIVKAHITAVGPDFWDENARVEIVANIYYEPFISSGLDSASFKKISVDPITLEETMLYHGRLKEGVANWLEWWANPAGEWWNSVWLISGIGDVKTQEGTYSDVFISIVVCTQGGPTGYPWAWAGFYEYEYEGFIGPHGSFGQEGTVTGLTQYEAIGLEQYYSDKQEQNRILDVWLNGGNRITNDYIANIAETNYIIVGMLQTEEERRDKVFNLPWTWTMLLDGWENIELRSFWWHDKEGRLAGEPTRVLVFYYIFEPYTLGWGPHTIDHELSWYNDVGADAWQEILTGQWEFAAYYW
ncbi:MAG: hypothetical protein ACW96X_06620 [Promethearchaeota archaeon]|jgi:hypothetical protein